MLELKVSTVRSVKFFSRKAVAYGVVVVAINRKVSGTVVEASHVTIAPSGSPGKVAAMRSADRREKEVGGIRAARVHELAGTSTGYAFVVHGFACLVCCLRLKFI